MASIAERRSAFRALHASGCFVMPNPWDAGTTRFLASLGFPALATTSAGFAFSAGLPDADRAISRDRMLGHIAGIVEATDLPVNADFQSGYARDPEGVATNVALCVSTGVAGLSIEDATGDADAPLFPFDLAVERVRAARAAIEMTGSGVVLTARSEGFLVGRPDLDETIRRLVAFAEAGADCLYAPDVNGAEAIRAIVAAVAPKPVNILMSGPSDLTVADLAAMGVRRISVGSALARAAWGGLARAARQIAAEGRFDAFAEAMPFGELNRFFEDLLPREAP